MATTKYSPADWKISAFGFPIGGYKDGTFLKVTRNTESAKMVFGSLGDAVVVQNLVRGGKVELTLMREHPCNALLSARLNLFEAGDVTGMGPFFAENIAAGTTAAAANCVIEKQPDMEGAQDPSAITWSLLLDDVSMFNGSPLA